MKIASNRFCDICNDSLIAMRYEACCKCDFCSDYLIFVSDAIFVCAFAIIYANSFLSNFNSHTVQNYLLMISIIKQDNSSDGRVVRTSASGAVDLGLIQVGSKQ